MRAAIGCIVSRDGGPIDEHELEIFAARSRLPWGGRPRICRQETAGLVWIPAFPGEEAAAGFGGNERFVVAADGTLDNRKELVRELGLPARASEPAGTPLVIAAACERWGDDCAARLVGELAFLAWDRRERRLLAVRDPLGLRELFFSAGDRQLLVASQCSMILDRPALSDLDVEYVADFLASQEPWGPATPFRSIRRLASAHRLTATADRIDIHRYWEAGRPMAHGRDDAEIAERFRALLQEAVERSLASGERVWAELSGGLDSSSIVCVAQEPLRSRATVDRDFATMTYIWEGTPQCDERKLVAAVVDKYGLVNHQIRCDDLFFDGAFGEALYRNEPHFGVLCQPMIQAIAERLRASGVSTLLSGTRAEAVVLDRATPPVHLADLVRAGQLGAFTRELMRWQRGTGKPLANLVLSHVLGPLLGRKRYLRELVNVEPWVSKDFARRMRLRERAGRFLAEGRFYGFAQRYQSEMLLRTEQMMTRGFLEWSCEIRHPFLYRPLVELALAIPWEQKIAPREAKLLLRRSLTGILPEEIRTRRGGAGPGAAMYKAFAKRWHAIEPVVRSSRLAELGFVDGAEFLRAAELVRFGSISSFAGFLCCLGFEYWLRAITGETMELNAERRPAG